MAVSTTKIAILDVQYEETFLGYEFTVTTQTECHLFMYYTLQEPWTHPTPSLRRGLLTVLGYRYCFTTYTRNEQDEAGDTLTHTFLKEPWPGCETRWFIFRGTVGGDWSRSVSPLFKLHRPIPEYGPDHTVELQPYLSTEFLRYKPTPGVLWNNIRNFNATVLEQADPDYFIGWQTSVNEPRYWSMWRTGMMFNLSTYSPLDKINWAKLHLHALTKARTGVFSSSVRCYFATSLSDESYALSDTKRITGVPIGPGIGYGAWPTATWIAINFGAARLPLINLGGIMKIGLREQTHDYNDVEPDWPNERYILYVISSPQALSAHRPFLEFNYSPRIN